MHFYYIVSANKSDYLPFFLWLSQKDLIDGDQWEDILL